MGNRLALRFLGVGNAKASELGSACAVLELDDQPALMIDCGPRSLDDYAAQYGETPLPPIVLTHLHLDHIGGLEALFYRVFFSQKTLHKLYVPATLISALHDKLAASPCVLSEGGANYWDAFQLIPVGDHFWLNSLLFEVFTVRHSGYRNAYGVGLRGAFVYTGDTRPIPELITHFANADETIFHDCALGGSPAHTGLDDLLREYDPSSLSRMVVYHYESAAAAVALEQAGLRVARPGQLFALKAARAGVREAGATLARVV